MDEIYTLQEVADKMKVSVQSVTKIVKSGQMKSILIGRQYRITETFLNEFLNGIFGDKPIEQTRSVNPTEKVNRKTNLGRTLLKLEIVPQEVEKCPTEPPINNTGAMPVDTLGGLMDQPQELGTNLFADGDSPVMEKKETVFEMIIRMNKVEGLTYAKIADRLNNLGIKTKRGKEWDTINMSSFVRQYKGEK